MIECITKEALKNCKCEFCKQYRRWNTLLLQNYVQIELMKTFATHLPTTKNKK